MLRAATEDLGTARFSATLGFMANWRLVAAKPLDDSKSIFTLVGLNHFFENILPIMPIKSL